MDLHNFNNVNNLKRTFCLDTNVFRDGNTLLEIYLDGVDTYIYLCEYNCESTSIYKPKYFVEINFINGLFKFNWYEDNIEEFTFLFERSLYVENVYEELKLLETILITAEKLNELRIRDKSREVLIGVYHLK